MCLCYATLLPPASLDKETREAAIYYFIHSDDGAYMANGKTTFCGQILAVKPVVDVVVSERVTSPNTMLT